MSDDIGISLSGSKIEQYQIYPVINGNEISKNVINFKAEERNINKEKLYQLHLFLNQKIQHIGLGFKLIYQFIKTYGNAYFGYGRVMNYDEIPKILNKLSKMTDFKSEEIINVKGQKLGLKISLI